MTIATRGPLRPIERILSVDAFRGLTIALMILVNDPGSWQHIYAPLKHAEWHGITPTDLVFPFFLFIVGISIVLSQSNSLIGKAAARHKIFTRSIKIFTLGLLLGLLPLFDFTNIRWAGVLQRIAVVYFVCALLYMQNNTKLEIKVFVALLLGYWLAMLLVPVPRIGVGSLEPARNLANWIDSQYLPGKLWRGTWDPEGLISTLPAIATCISGMFVGRLLLSDRPSRKQFKWLFWSGLIAMFAGLAWDVYFPINKNIWTSSYVLFTSGAAAMALSCLIYIIDIKGAHRAFNFAIIFGSNAIMLYALSYVLMFTLDHGLGVRQIAFEGLLGLGLAPEFASLMWAVGFTAFCFIPALILYRRKIFIKL